MHVRHLTLLDFRSYPTAELALEPGISTLVGLNGQGKTNLVEAIGYVATLGSHRVSTDQPLVRFGAERAVVRCAVVRDGRETLVELELNPGRANRARLGRAPLTRPRDVLGTLRTVLASGRCAAALLSSDDTGCARCQGWSSPHQCSGTVRSASPVSSTRYAARHPSQASSPAASGAKTVLASPATSVSVVSARTRCAPPQCVSAANAGG